MKSAFARLKAAASRWMTLKKNVWYKAIVSGSNLSDIFRDGKKVWLKENTEIPYSSKSYWVYDPVLQYSMCVSSNSLSDFVALHVERGNVVPATVREQKVLDAYWQEHVAKIVKRRKQALKKFDSMKSRLA